jgi:hypothetical protein
MNGVGTVYFVEEEVVFVVAVANDNKRPGYWRSRLSKTR